MTVSVAEYILSWKSKGLSAESIKPPATYVILDRLAEIKTS